MNVRREASMLGMGSAAALVLVIGALLTPHFRHGWPFSFHHDVAGNGKPRLAASQAGANAPTEAPRTTVALDPSRLDAIGVRF